MNWLILLFALEMGYAPYYGSFNGSEHFLEQNIYYVTMETEAILLDYIFIGGVIKTYINDKPDDYTFSPFEADYLFKAGLRYKNLEVGFKHFCLHPVRPYEMYYEPQGSTDSGYEEFYIRISNKY